MKSFGFLHNVRGTLMVKLYVLALLCSGSDVLLLRRSHVDFGSGLYSLVGGSVQQDETALHAMSREVSEEVDLEIPSSKFQLVHVIHRQGTENPLILLFFKADVSGMHPKNNEPDKHDDMRWFSLNQLPENMIPAHKQALECIGKKLLFSQHGWEEGFMR
jgi:8-oxo-dGTP diphosphatase